MSARSILSASLATALFAALAAPVQAQTPPGAGMGPPRDADAVAPWVDGLFTRLDVNVDGAVTGGELLVLTQGEAGARGGARLRAMVSQSDSSGDARISREELAAGARRMFTRLDRDGDGRLADEELPQPPPVVRPMPAPTPPPADPFPTPPGPDGVM